MPDSNMRNKFIEQTGLEGDVFEYGDASRSQVDTMFYTGDDPWHRIGTKLDNPATALEAIHAAGLNWKVQQYPVSYEFLPDGLFNKIDGRMAIVREDTQEVFQIATERYVPLQNTEAFNFFDGVVGAGEAIYHTAGALKGGRLIWIMAKLDGDLGVTGDAAEKYIMLSNSHDGSQAVDMRFCVRRVICKNTYKLALHNDEKHARIRHTGNVLAKINETRELLGLSEAYFANFMRGMERLADKKLSESQSVGYFNKVIGIDPNSPETMSTRKINIVNDIVRLYNGDGKGSELVTANGTAWGAFNAVSEYLEHHRSIRNSADQLQAIDKRMASSYFGSGARIEQRAWDAALNLAR